MDGLIIDGISLCDNIIAFDNMDTLSTGDDPYLVIETISLKLLTDSTSAYTCTCKYSIYDNPTGRTSYDAINFQYTGMTGLTFTYTVTDDFDDIVQDCYNIIVDYFSGHTVCYEKNEVPEFAMVLLSTTSFAYSKDHFLTYTTGETTGSVPATIERLASNGEKCGGYFTSDHVWHFTVDAGETWNTKSGINSAYISFSDGGKYIIIGGNSGSDNVEDRPVTSNDYGVTWESVPTSMLHQNTYGSTCNNITRDGQYSIIACRSEGLAINDNYLDENDWSGSLYSSNIGGWRRPAIAPDSSCWAYCETTWLNKLAAEYGSITADFDETYPPTGTITSVGQTIATNSGDIYCRVYTNSTYYGIWKCTESGGWSRIVNTSTPSWYHSPDNDAFLMETTQSYTLVIDGSTIAGLTLNSAIWYLSAICTRTGVIIATTSSNELKVSYDRGDTWIDRTDTMTLTSSSRMSRPQWNCMV